MPLVKWDPFRNMATLQDRINRLFDDAFPRSTDGGEDLSASDWHPPVDIYDAGQGIIIQVDLPGVEKKEVSVEVKENTLTIRGHRSFDTDISNERYYRKERAYGAFHRTFVMHTPIDPDSIKATFKNGVLKIEVATPHTEKPEQVSVKIE